MFALNQKRRSRSTRASRSKVSVTPSCSALADGRAHRVLHACMQQEHALVDVHVRRANLEDAVQCVGDTRAPPPSATAQPAASSSPGSNRPLSDRRVAWIQRQTRPVPASWRRDFRSRSLSFRDKHNRSRPSPPQLPAGAAPRRPLLAPRARGPQPERIPAGRMAGSRPSECRDDLLVLFRQHRAGAVEQPPAGGEHA